MAGTLDVPVPGGAAHDQLYGAAAAGDADRVAALLAAGADADCTVSKGGASALLVAAERGHAAAARLLLDAGADAAYQDAAGRNALMLAARAGSADLVSRLLAAGVPWNALDQRAECAGDYAAAAGQADTAELLLQAGVRAELLLGALGRRSSRPAAARPRQPGSCAPPGDARCSSDGVAGAPGVAPGAGLPAPAGAPRRDAVGEVRGADARAYLEQDVHYGETSGEERLMDADGKAVMMQWEAPLMEAHAHVVARGDVLNVGFGLGLVDEAIQRRRPRSHTIIEAHPGVHARMLRDGWDKRPGVRVVFGRWQDAIGQLGRQFDGIFFDTYSEFYEDMREFHEALPRLLRPGGVYSYFNGLAADNAFFHRVYCELAARELAALGFTTQFVPLPVAAAAAAEVWEGVRNRYWRLDMYMLPVCHLEGAE